jgi:hypothetical protein
MRQFVLGLDPAMTADSTGLVLGGAVLHPMYNQPIVEVLAIETLRPPQSAATIVAGAIKVLHDQGIPRSVVRVVADIGGKGMAVVQPLLAAFPLANLFFIELTGGTTHGASARQVPIGVGARGRPQAVPVWSASRTMLFTDLNALGSTRLRVGPDVNPDELAALRQSALATQPKPASGDNKLKVQTAEGDDTLLAMSYVVYGLTYRVNWREPKLNGGPRRAPSALAWT